MQKKKKCKRARQCSAKVKKCKRARQCSVGYEEASSGFPSPLSKKILPDPLNVSGDDDDDDDDNDDHDHDHDHEDGHVMMMWMKMLLINAHSQVPDLTVLRHQLHS